MAVVHKIDPDADTIIILKNPSTEFAVWGPDEFLDAREQRVEDTDSKSQRDVFEDEEDEEVRYEVSSRHLILASKVFRAMMTGDRWTQGICQDDGLFYLYPEDHDAEAFLILMNMFHLRNKDVPGEVSLELMAKIAVLVDYYECYDAIEIFVHSSKDHLLLRKQKDMMPKMYGRELMLTMCVAVIFDMSDVFTYTTRVAMETAYENVRTLDLPIRQSMSDQINKKRSEVITNTMDGLHRVLEKFNDEAYVCPRKSDFSEMYRYTNLGALRHGMEKQGLLSVNSTTAYTGLCYLDLRQKIVDMPIIRAKPQGRDAHPCNLWSRDNDGRDLHAVLNSCPRELPGLKLQDFQNRKE